jgi:flagellar protein FlbD
MILLHRLRGEPFLIDPDLIETVEGTPDTVLTQIDGHLLVVANTPEQVAARVRFGRAAALAAPSLVR